MEERWFSLEEIAQYLGVTKDTLYKWVGQKTIPAYKVGRLWKFNKDEVDAWVRKNKVS